MLIWLPLSLNVEQNSHNKLEKNRVGSERTEEINATEESTETGKIDQVNLGIKLEDMMTDLPSVVLNNPLQVYRWYQSVEKGIIEILKTLSRATNSQLQKYKILPKNLPDILLEAAAKASSSADPVVGNMPNLLNLTIETGNAEKYQNLSQPEVREVKQKEAINLLTVHLRLSDLEFADPVVMAGRNRMGQISKRLSSLTREYKKKEQERIIAEAEAAWRSSWIEE